MKILKYTVIKNTDQYNQYCDALERLILNNNPQAQEEIELLALLIENYNHTQTQKYTLTLNPVELLDDLLKENNISQTQLANKLKISKQLLNDILKYRREITKSLAYKLEQEFAIDFAAFLRPYKLKQAG